MGFRSFLRRAAGDAAQNNPSLPFEGRWLGAAETEGWALETGNPSGAARQLPLHRGAKELSAMAAPHDDVTKRDLPKALGRSLSFVWRYFFSSPVMRVQKRPVAMSQMRRLSAGLTTTPPTVMVWPLMNSASS